MAERLNEEYRRSGCESMSAFAIELIKDGLTYRETKELRRSELDKLSESFDTRLSGLEKQIAKSSETTYTQLNRLSDEHALLVKTSSACCNLSEAYHFGEIITREQLDSGYYDFLPIRFWRTA